MSTKRMAFISGIVIAAFLITLGGRVDAANPAAISTLVPATNYWPLPINPRPVSDWSDTSVTSSTAYWWKYTWYDGNANYWEAQPVNGVDTNVGSAVPNCSTATAILSAAYLADGAWGDVAGQEANDRLSVSIHKNHVCSYFNSGSTRALRWYTQGWQQFNNATTFGTYKYLTFPEYSSWTGVASTMKLGQGNNPPSHQLSMYAYHANSALEWSHKTRWNAGSNPALNTYAVVPDMPIDLSVVASPQPRYCVVHQPGQTPWTTYWNAIRSDSRNVVEASDACASGWQNGTWKMFIESTNATFPGHPGNLIYVGFWETASPSTVGVCEEWWFAPNLGPVYIASYSVSREATCVQSLAISNNVAFTLPAVDYPDVYLPEANVRPASNGPSAYPAPGFIYTKRPALGYLKLDQSCISANCWVDYLQ